MMQILPADESKARKETIRLVGLWRYIGYCIADFFFLLRIRITGRD